MPKPVELQFVVIEVQKTKKEDPKCVLNAVLQRQKGKRKTQNSKQ